MCSYHYPEYYRSYMFFRIRGECVWKCISFVYSSVCGSGTQPWIQISGEVVLEIKHLHVLLCLSLKRKRVETFTSLLILQNHQSLVVVILGALQVSICKWVMCYLCTHKHHVEVWHKHKIWKLPTPLYHMPNIYTHTHTSFENHTPDLTRRNIFSCYKHIKDK